MFLLYDVVFSDLGKLSVYATDLQRVRPISMVFYAACKLTYTFQINAAALIRKHTQNIGRIRHQSMPQKLLNEINAAAFI